MDPRLLHTLKKISLPLLLVVVAAYFVYHLMEGRYGIRSWQVLKVNYAHTQERTNKLTAKVEALNDKIKRLSPETLDVDYVEELVHEKMGVYHKNDLIMQP